MGGPGPASNSLLRMNLSRETAETLKGGDAFRTAFRKGFGQASGQGIDLRQGNDGKL